MKMIDFTPLVTMGYKKVLTRLAIASFAVALAVKMAGYQELASGLALGGAVGLLDTLIMFVGIQRSLPQGEPEAALKTMKRFHRMPRCGPSKPAASYPPYGSIEGTIRHHVHGKPAGTQTERLQRKQPPHAKNMAF